MRAEVRAAGHGVPRCGSVGMTGREWRAYVEAEHKNLADAQPAE